MIRVEGERVYQFKAVTDIWTGNICSNERNLITTGLLGSIRWWFEVLVRGLGGYACDPTDKEHKNCEGRDHCVSCELFGCTGWARKFRFQVLNDQGHSQTEQIKAGTSFQFRFTPLRYIEPVEWTLLDATLRLIADYGAIGGKTIFKPTDEPNRVKEIHHHDYGIVELINIDHPIFNLNLAELKQYASRKEGEEIRFKGKESNYEWASLVNFWFVNQKVLNRESVKASSFNKVLGRKESKTCRDCGFVHNPPIKCSQTHRYPSRESEYLVSRDDKISKWLAGSRQESKKVFSFKNPSRTFGFVNPGLIGHPDMKKRLDSVWGENGWTYLSGGEILDKLFAPKEDRK
ncbi:MAG: hypothetical protein SAMD01599839_16950 [Rectinema sp.]